MAGVPVTPGGGRHADFGSEGTAKTLSTGISHRTGHFAHATHRVAQEFLGLGQPVAQLLEVLGGITSGSGSGRSGTGTFSGSNQEVFIAQPLDIPFVREARRKVAEAGIDSADEANRAVWVKVVAEIKKDVLTDAQRKATEASAPK